ITPARSIELAMRLALEEIADTPVVVRRIAGDADQARAVVTRFDPHRRARARPMHHPMRHAAERHDGPISERRRLGETLQSRRDPAAVLLREVTRFPQAAAWRNRKYNLTRGRVDAQGIAPRPAVAADAYAIGRTVEDDLDHVRHGRPAIEQGRHAVSK